MLITELNNKHLQEVLVEMCSRVDADPSTIDVKEEDWYLKYTWTAQEQESFADWLGDYVLTNKGAAKELVQFPNLIKNKQQRKKFVDMFLLNYGWKVQEEV